MAGPIARIFDSHTHAFPDALADRAMAALVAAARPEANLQPSHDGTVPGLLAAMDRARIDRAILCAVATKPSQVEPILDWLTLIESPRIVPFASVHPDYPEPEAVMARIADAGLKGIKFHTHYMDCCADDPRVVRLARAVAKHGLAMVFHAGYDIGFPDSDLAAPFRIRNLHEAVPDLRMQACHLGGYRRWDEVLDTLAGLPIYFDTSFALGVCPPDLLHAIIDRHDPDYLMFGSDAPWTDQAHQVQLLLDLDVPPELKQRMCWENVCRFAGIPAETP